jgi:hypothetical protein
MLVRFINLFKINYSLIIFLGPLVMFTLGFSMRLIDVDWVIDLGFFFTEFIYIAIYSLFTAAICLGQIRYWKVKMD